MHKVLLLPPLLGERIQYLQELLHVLSLQSVCCPIITVPPKGIGGDDFVCGSGVPEVLDLHVFERSQDLPHLVDQDVLLLHHFLVHLEPLSMLVEALLVLLLLGFDTFEPTSMIGWRLGV